MDSTDASDVYDRYLSKFIVISGFCSVSQGCCFIIIFKNEMLTGRYAMCTGIKRFSRF